jgi:hypothetical protein
VLPGYKYCDRQLLVMPHVLHHPLHHHSLSLPGEKHSLQYQPTTRDENISVFALIVFTYLPKSQNSFVNFTCPGIRPRWLEKTAFVNLEKKNYTNNI